MATPNSIDDHLAALYGGQQAPAISRRLRGLMQEHFLATHPGKRPSDALPVSERDAILIAYADQVREPGVAPLRTLRSFIDTHAAGVVTGLHVLPFFPSSSDDGFAVIDYQAVDPALGSWDDIGALGRSFELMVDGVFNHVSSQNAWFRRFLHDEPTDRDRFIVVDDDPDLSQVVRPRTTPLLTTFETAAGPKRVWTTFGPDQIDNNLKNPDVLLALIDALLFYVRRGARFIRLDAIAYLWKQIGTPCIHLPQTHLVVQLMRAILDEVAPNVMLVTETNVPHRDNLSYFGDGTNEAQLVYNFALPPLVLHSLVTGSAEALTGWADTLSMPTRRVAFLNFLASHDGIGVNPVAGILKTSEIDYLVTLTQKRGGFVSQRRNADGTTSPYELNINYLDALSDPQDPSEQVQIDRLVTAHAMMLSLPGLPAIYFHSLFGSRGHRAAAEASGLPRRVNRQRLIRSELERDLGDAGSRRSQVLRRLLELLRQRRESPAFEPTGPAEILSLDPRVFALRRVSRDGKGEALCLHNVSADTVTMADQSLSPYQTSWLVS
jgi:glycosidase